MVFNTVFRSFKNSAFELKAGSHANVRGRLRQLTAATFVLALGGCVTSGDDENLGKVGYVQGYLGGVVADEPRAATIGRDILSAGGTAADAMTAMYFAASVTLPSAASLGGGGVCVYHDSKTKKTEVLDFLPRAAQMVPSGTERPVAVPMNARGFFLLQSRYGALRWPQLISPAENLARFGTQVSRALAADLTPVAQALLQDPEAARVFSTKDGKAVREGDFIKQFDLAATLTELRSKGPGAFYTGLYATRFVEAVQDAGGYLTKDDLRKALPVWREPVKTLDWNYKIANFAPPAAAGGVVGAQMWNMLVEEGSFDAADPALQAHQLAEFAMRAYGDRAQWMRPDGSATASAEQLVNEARTETLLNGYSEEKHQAADQLQSAPKMMPETPSAASFVAVDRFGSAAACNVTNNNNFGVGRIAPGTGVLLAALPGINGRGPMSLGPVLVVNPNSNDVYFAGAASRGVAAPTSLINVMAHTVLAEKDMVTAQNMPRVHHGGAPDVLFFERKLDANVQASLTQKGYEMSPLTALGVVNGVYCPYGLRVSPQTCTTGNDQRGYGLSLGAE